VLGAGYGSANAVVSRVASAVAGMGPLVSEEDRRGAREGLAPQRASSQERVDAEPSSISTISSSVLRAGRERQRCRDRQRLWENMDNARQRKAEAQVSREIEAEKKIYSNERGIIIKEIRALKKAKR